MSLNKARKFSYSFERIYVPYPLIFFSDLQLLLPFILLNFVARYTKLADWAPDF
jgi:hypothetical protein